MHRAPPPPGYRLTRKAGTTGQAPTANPYPEVFPGAWDQWLNRWTSPITAAEIDKRLQEALNLYGNTLDKICKGSTCPPPEYLAPTLYRRAQEVKEVRSQLAKDTDPTNRFELGSAVYDHAYQAGKGLFLEADATWARHLKALVTLPSLPSWLGDSPWSKVAIAAAVVAGIFGAAALVGHVADTSRETRRLFRGGT